MPLPAADSQSWGRPPFREGPPPHPGGFLRRCILHCEAYIASACTVLPMLDQSCEDYPVVNLGELVQNLSRNISMHFNSYQLDSIS